MKVYIVCELCSAREIAPYIRESYQLRRQPKGWESVLGMMICPNCIERIRKKIQEWIR